jgi:SAM-dependent methyltransferase
MPTFDPMTRGQAMFDSRGPTFLELARQALSSTTRGYDLLATKFDYTPFRTPDSLLVPMVEIIGAQGSIACALDVCCGTGAAMGLLRPLCREYVTGVDLSRGMLAQARENLASAPGTAEVRLIAMDAMAMTFDGEFDVVTSVGAFGHVLHDEQDRFVDRIRASLVPGGRFVFITHLMPPVGSRAWLASRAFNAAMHLRNALIKPEFVMFYLTFPLERALEVLPRHGFGIEVHAPYAHTPYPMMRVVVATRSEIKHNAGP